MDATEDLSLQQLDPKPIDSFEHDENNQRSLLSISHLISSSVLSLGRNSGDGATRGRSSFVFYLTKLQKYSSYAFTVFLSFHVTNTSLIPLFTQSVAASESYLLLTRPYYQSLLLEPLLVGLPIVTHMIAGISLRLHQRKVNLKRYGAKYLPVTTRLQKRLKVWPPISWTSITGYLMVPLVGCHVLVNRFLPWMYEGGSSSVGLGYVAHSFAKHPFVVSFNYFMMIVLATGHFCWGFCRWNMLTIAGSSQEARRRWWTINGVSAALAITWMAGGLGVVARGGRASGWVGKGYDSLLRHLWL